MLSSVALAMAPAPCERGDDAQQHEECVQVEIAGLHTAERTCASAREPGEAVQRSVDQQLVAEAQEHALGNPRERTADHRDRKSTRLNSSHVKSSYAVF